MSAKKETVIVADDDPRLLRLVQFNLQQAGYRVITASDGNRALRLAENENPDLLLLDVRMPLMDGLEVCRRVRNFSTVPIIMVTAKDSEEDKVAGLDAGADDYLTKPFGAPELMARVRAVVRRAKLYSGDTAEPVFESGDLKVDFAQQLASLSDKPVNLTPTEYRIVAYLARNAGRVVTQADLLTKVWGPEYESEAHLLRVNIARLRQKIEQDAGTPRHVITRPGIGYYLAKQ
jgi:two-component system, OmpR family, KDP operon response regulator KdpE